ncbi:hypothetical protein G647_06101 [Cladophialophora carrionii CBS 160.54]|uniref:Aminoglycoside phosphotransferase domain-containing protein n=1 Tax=Cladophialophora carrionii CBS 160.54 TaxID=1279043 RepID=V9D5V1_9EURO|nr:uncharacterized protein G647_06101 [Cladophialophora carrionii CBS 160.54]ETI22031.1 hypothetical protein G647_06101 [Cladophialophora carrionii CBS 160.54]
MPPWSKIRHFPPLSHLLLRSSRNISLTCRGKSINREELFQYTNGRFLTRDQQQRDARYVKFDLDALCAIAANTGPSVSPVREIEKLEGGFNKALRLHRADGTELIAKIPCPNAGLAKYTTASEVAVLQYGRRIQFAAVMLVSNQSK